MSLRFLLASLKQKPKQAGAVKQRGVTDREAAVPKGTGRAVRLAAERSA